MSNKYQWLWRFNSSDCVLNNSDEWRKYSDVEMNIIENAYDQKRDQIELNNYIIDLKHFVQINKLDPVKQHCIKRISCEDVLYSKEERYLLPKQDILHIPRESFDEEDECK